MNPPSLPDPLGFTHAVRAAPHTRLVFVAGQTGHRADGTLVGDSLVEQFGQACANVMEALRAAGAGPADIVSLQIFTTEMDGYRAELQAIGEAYRRHLGRHYPAISLFGVAALFDPAAKVEVVAIAAVEERQSRV